MCSHLGRRTIWVDIKEGAENLKERKVLSGKIKLAMFNQKTSGERGVALDFGIWIIEGANEQLEERLGPWGDGVLHASDNFGKTAN